MSCSQCASYLSSMAHFHAHKLAKASFTFNCSLCTFQSCSLKDTLSHCLIEGHDISLLKVPSKYTDESGSTASATGKPSLTMKEHASRNYEIKIKSEPEIYPKIKSEPETLDPVLQVPSPGTEVIIGAQVPQPGIETFENLAMEQEHSEQENIPVAGSDETMDLPWDAKVKLSCRKCTGVLIARKSDARGKAITHASACFGIKPFSCTKCSSSFARKPNAKKHAKSVACAGADIVLANKEEDEKKVKEALDICYPEMAHETVVLM